MRDELKLFLLFQAVPLVFLAFIVGSALLYGPVEYYPQGMITTNFMTATMPPGSVPTTDLTEGLLFSLFIFVGGLPFELMLIWHHYQDSAPKHLCGFITRQ